MHSTKTLLAIAALAGTSLSQKSDSEFCASYQSSLFGIFAEGPTTPAAVLSFLETRTASPPIPSLGTTSIDPRGHQDQLCAIFSVLPSSLVPGLQSYAAGILDLAKDHSSEYLGYFTDCLPEDQGASSTSYINYIFTATGNICETTATPTATPAPGAASNGTYPTSPTPTATGSTTLIPTAAAARPTGAILGAAAGFLGVAAML